MIADKRDIYFSEKIISCRKNLISRYYHKKSILRNIKKEFENRGYAKLSKFLSRNIFEKIKNEVYRLKNKKIRRDFVMPVYNTPRNMSVIGGGMILKESPILNEFYQAQEIKNVLEKIIGNRIYQVKHEHEFMVINFLDGKADTHGWHLDDPDYALIVVIVSPDQKDGGLLEFVPDWLSFIVSNRISSKNALTDGIEFARCQDRIKPVYLQAGDCYLLHASKNLHRVSPILNGAQRIALNLAFSKHQQCKFGDTADYLYGDKFY